jgi:shikimate kinase
VSTKPNIYLVGPMGAGKTAVGRQLADKLGLEFHDSDQEIEQRTGVDIPYIFEKEGEQGFRERERDVIADLTSLEGIVLATGGGAVLDSRNRARLRETGTIVYLDTSVEQQLRRTNRSTTRPLLMTGNRRAVLKKLREDREPLYRELADIEVDTSGKRVSLVVAIIYRELLDRHLAPLQT